LFVQRYFNSNLASQELVRIARLIEDDLLEGASNREARNLVNKLLSKVGKSLYRDDSWRGIKEIWDVLDDAGIDYHTTKAEYKHNDDGIPNAKEWKFEIEFVNDKGRPTTLYGTATAWGAGSVEDPLDKYDVTVNVF